MKNAWDQVFAGDEPLFGVEPSGFLRAESGRLPPPPARVLSLAEGEGRNAVYLAALGYEVTAVDASSVGMEKARNLAASRGVTIATDVFDLETYPIAPSSWDLVVSIFSQLPPPLRRSVHRRVVEGLRPGGVLLLEAFAEPPRVGGPSETSILYGEAILREDLAGLEIELLREEHRDVHDGRIHQPGALVVELVARKPGLG